MVINLCYGLYAVYLSTINVYTSTDSIAVDACANVYGGMIVPPEVKEKIHSQHQKIKKKLSWNNQQTYGLLTWAKDIQISGLPVNMPCQL